MEKVIVVGSLNVDLTVYTEQFPRPGETLVGKKLTIGVGGKGNNQATAAHRSGGEVYMVGRMGTDAMGDVLRRHYEQEGMTRRYITESADCETGTATIQVDGTGQNSIVIVKGANAALNAADVRLAAGQFAGAGAVLTQLETELAPILTAKELAAENGVPFILNPAPYRALPPELLAGLDWITPNETEAEALTGIAVTDEESCRAAAKELQRMGVKNVIITLGSRGVYCAAADGSAQTVPCPKMKAVDTTGAGDTFNGAFAVALAGQLPLHTALCFANCAAAISVTRPGAAASVPTRQQTLALLESHYGLKG